MKFDPRDPTWECRDRFLLSKGHALNTLQILLADLGYYPKEETMNFMQDGSILGGHVDSACPGMEVVGGSLGHGLGVAAGMALGLKMSDSRSRVYVILGDGECQEGSIWEAVMFAAHHKLDNLEVLLDRNGLGSEDFTENTCTIKPAADKWRAFGWDVEEMNGHDIGALMDSLKADRPQGKPVVHICHTRKGKGMSWCENTPKSHHTMPPEIMIDDIRKELADA